MSRKNAGSNSIIVGLDMGTTKICAIIGMRNENGKINILGMGRAPSLGGISEGVVININKTTEAIRKAIEEAKRSSNVNIGSVYAGIAGRHLKSETKSNSVFRKSPNSEISKDELDELSDQMYRIATDHGSSILHVLPQEFYIDGNRSDDPIGMEGSKFEVEYHIITGQVQAAQNIKRCIERCNIVVSDIIVEPIASAKAVLTEDEMKEGVAILDVGGGTSDLAIFHEGRIRYTKVIPIGGQKITHDIKEAFRITEKYAEALKVQYGDALPNETRNNEVVMVPGINDRPAKQVSIKNLSLVINARLQELFEKVEFEISQSGLKDKLVAGIVLTGGGAMLNNVRQLLEYITQLDVKIGYPNQHLAKGAVSEVNSPMYATGTGLVIYGIEKENSSLNSPQNVVSGGNKEDIAGAGGGFMNKIKDFGGSFLKMLSEGDNADDFNK